MHTDWTQITEITAEGLPDVITGYLVASAARDLDIVTASFAEDATVTDEGHTYHGADAIRSWRARAASEYTYTTRLTKAARVDDNHFVVVQHLEGDFPGGVVDLTFRFTLNNRKIAELVIEP
jgi:ketosteroid isomerase-like protein